MGNDQVALATGLVTVGPKSHFDFLVPPAHNLRLLMEWVSFGIDPNGIGDQA